MRSTPDVTSVLRWTTACHATGRASRPREPARPVTPLRPRRADATGPPRGGQVTGRDGKAHTAWASSPDVRRVTRRLCARSVMACHCLTRRRGPGCTDVNSDPLTGRSATRATIQNGVPAATGWICRTKRASCACTDLRRRTRSGSAPSAIRSRTAMRAMLLRDTRNTIRSGRVLSARVTSAVIPMLDERIAEFLMRMRAGFESLAAQIPRILADPRAYQRESMMLALAAVLLVLMVVFILYALYDAIDTWRTRRRMGLSVKRRNRFVRLAPPFVVLVAAVFLLAIAPLVPATGAACGTCHAVSEAVARWESGSHSETSCYGCHAAPGVSGALAASFAGVRNIGRASSDGAVRSGVNDAGCLQCHVSVRSGIVEGAVRMRHSDVIEARMQCTSCHSRVGHAESQDAGLGDQRMTRHIMSICLTCHDGVTARSDCDICHDGRPLDRATTVSGGVTPVQVGCKGCHTSTTERVCVDCHGLELPHPPVFMRRHAAMSSDDPGLCARCHSGASSRLICACHTETNVHGSYSVWFPVHGPAASSTGPGGCNCHRGAFCGKCHDRPPF